MVLKDVLRRLGASALESDTDTEMSEEFVADLDKDDQTIAKGNRKPEALPKVPEDGPEDFATSTSLASSPSIPSEILPLSSPPIELLNDEDNHNLAIGSRKPSATPKALPGGPEDIAGTISRARSPVVSVKTSTLFIEPLDAKNNHNIAQGNNEHVATSSGLVTIPETSTSITSPISSPKNAFEAPALSVESLDKESHIMAKGKENINDAAENSASIPMENISTASLTSSAKTPFRMSALSVEPLDQDISAMAEGKNNTKDAAESFAAGSQSQISTLSSATPPETIVQDLALSVDIHVGGESKAVITSDKSTTPENPKEEAENMVKYDSVTQRMNTRAVVGAANLSDFKSSKSGDAAPARDVLQDDSEEENTTPPKKRKPKKKKKTKPVTPDMPPSSFDGTVIAPRNSSITAAINSSINTPANISITAPSNVSLTAPTSFSNTATISFSLTAPASCSTTAWANPMRKVNLILKHRFGFDEYRDELKCRRHECGKLTNCYDGSTVICPRCGVNSFFRYCSLECLLHPDMAFHWAQECGTCSIGEESLPLVDKSTLIIRPAAMRPYIECDARDNPARHRQAVFHSSNGAAGDYFVFNDNSLRPSGLSGHVAAIGTGQVIAVVSIVPDHGAYQGHSIFQEILEDCLRRGFSRPDKCLALIDVITRQLVYSRQWSQEVVDCLVFQMRNEFAYEIPQEMLYRFNPMVPVSA